MSSPSEKLLTDLQETEAQSDELYNHCDNLDLDLENLNKLLNIPQEVAIALDHSDDLLRDMILVLGAVSIIPPIASEASALHDRLADIRKVIHPAREKADALAKRSKELQEYLEKVQEKDEEAMMKLSELSAHVATFSARFQSILNCIHDLTDPHKRDDGIDDLNSFASDTDPTISVLKDALETANNSIDRLNREMNGIAASLEALMPTVSVMDEFQKILNPIYKLLKRLEKALKHKISFLGIKYSVYDILKKLDEFTAYLKKKLESLALKYLKHFIKEINFHPKLPSLPDFGLLDAINFDQLKALCESLEKSFKNLESEILGFLNQLDGFDITCGDID